MLFRSGSGAGYRYALRAIHSPSAYIPEFQKGMAQALGKSSSLTQQGLEGAGNILRQAKEAVENLKQSPALKRFFRSQQLSKTDFYVRANGDVVPCPVGFVKMGNLKKNSFKEKKKQSRKFRNPRIFPDLFPHPAPQNGGSSAQVHGNLQNF